MPRVLSVTTSLGTRWEAYSQALIASMLPAWERIVIDGRKRWSPTGFVGHVVDRDVDYVVHVDEDCFLLEASGIDDVIAQMERDPSIVAAGVPDGGYYYREHNPAALNLFFVIFRADALRKAWRNRDAWSNLRYESTYGEEVARQRPELDLSRVRWDEGEPYYPLFWSLLADGGRFLYLEERLRRDRWSSLVVSPSGRVIAEHLWYLRLWFSQDVMPGHDCPNVARYMAVELDIKERHASDLRFKLARARSTAARLARRFLRSGAPS